MSSLELAGLTMLSLAFAGGLRSTVRLWRVWRRDRESKRSLILAAFALIAVTITGAAVFFGVLSVRRALGFDALPWAPVASLVVASLVFLIPMALDWLVARIAGGPR